MWYDGETGRSENSLCSFLQLFYLDYILLLMDHGVLQEKLTCVRCKSERDVVCDMDFNPDWLMHLCQASYTVPSKDNQKQIQKRCDHQVSALAGTWFERTKVDIYKQLQFIAWYLYQDPPHSNVHKDLQISASFASTLKSRVKEVCRVWLEENRQQLGGKGMGVEVVIHFRGKRKYNRGRVLKGDMIVAGREKCSDKFFAENLKFKRKAIEGKKAIKGKNKRKTKVDEEQLREILRKHIKPGSSVYTSTSRPLTKAIKDLQPLYKHTVVHVVKDKKYLSPGLNKVLRLIRDLKQGLPTYGPKNKGILEGNLWMFHFRRMVPVGDCIQVFLTTVAKIQTENSVNESGYDSLIEEADDTPNSDSDDDDRGRTNNTSFSDNSVSDERDESVYNLQSINDSIDESDVTESISDSASDDNDEDYVPESDTGDSESTEDGE